MGFSKLFEELNQYTQDVYKLKPTVDNMIINDTWNRDTYLQTRDDNIYTIDSISKHSLSNYSTNFKKLTNEELEIIKGKAQEAGLSISSFLRMLGLKS